MTGISKLPHCYGNSVAMVAQLPWQPGQNLNNSFFFSRIESIFGMEVPWHDRHQPATSLLW